MPGWTAKPQGGLATSVQQDGLFQDTALPTGQSEVHFNFTPPYMTVGWVACALGLFGLLWQAVQIARFKRGATAIE